MCVHVCVCAWDKYNDDRSVYLSFCLSVYCIIGHRFSPGWYCGSVAVK